MIIHWFQLSPRSSDDAKAQILSAAQMPCGLCGRIIDGMIEDAE